MVIECFCEDCNIVALHDFKKSISDDVLTTITVCKKCGKATVDCGPMDDEEDLCISTCNGKCLASDGELDCNGADAGKSKCTLFNEMG